MLFANHEVQCDEILQTSWALIPDTECHARNSKTSNEMCLIEVLFVYYKNGLPTFCNLNEDEWIGNHWITLSSIEQLFSCLHLW